MTLGWVTPWSRRHGETPDISAFLQFRFYEPVYYLDVSQPFPSTKEKLGYWLGVSNNVGDKLCFHILTSDTHRVIERSVVRSAELRNLSLPFPNDDFTPKIHQQDTPRDDNEDSTSTSSSTTDHEIKTIPTRTTKYIRDYSKASPKKRKPPHIPQERFGAVKDWKRS